MLDFIVTLYGINTILVGFCLHELVRIRKVKEGQIADVTEQYVEVADVPADVTELDTETLTENEIMRVEREAEFDLRIARMKEELSNRLPDVPRKGVEADILMPGIHNLPHNIIADYYDDLPDVEITQ